MSKTATLLISLALTGCGINAPINPHMVEQQTIVEYTATAPRISQDQVNLCFENGESVSRVKLTDEAVGKFIFTIAERLETCRVILIEQLRLVDEFNER